MKIDMQILDSRYGREWPIPAPATAGSAGVDLRAADISGLIRLGNQPLEASNFAIKPGGRETVGTGIKIHVADPNYAAFVLPRSGLAARHGITVVNAPGLIDADYTGEIKVALINLSDKPYSIEPGERIAQLVIQPVARPKFNVVDSLDETERGDGGFGSTGRG